MKIVLALIGASFLSAGISHAQEPTDPATLLDSAVKATKMCSYQPPKIEELNKSHELLQERKDEEEDKKEEGNAKKLSLAIVFRANRFTLGPTVISSTLNGRAVQVIEFSPRPKEEHIGIEKGEDRRFNWGLNRLMGKVYVDDETGKIIHVSAELKEPDGFLKSVKLEELDFTLDETPGVRQVLTMEINYSYREWRKLLVGWTEVHDKYTYKFPCSSEGEETR